MVKQDNQCIKMTQDWIKTQLQRKYILKSFYFQYFKANSVASLVTPIMYIPEQQAPLEKLVDLFHVLCFVL